MFAIKFTIVSERLKAAIKICFSDFDKVSNLYTQLKVF